MIKVFIIHEGLHLNNNGAALFTENILSAFNQVAWPQNVKENSSSKSFSDSHGIDSKGNTFTSTKSIKIKHPKNLVFGHLNVDSISNNCVSIDELIKRTLDIFLISETHFQMSNLKLKERLVLRKIEMPLEENFSFTLMKN